MNVDKRQGAGVRAVVDDVLSPKPGDGEHARPSWVWWTIGAGILAVGGLIAALLLVLRPEPTPTMPQERDPLVEVAKAELQRRPLAIEGHGVVQPRETLALTAQVGGEVTAIDDSLEVGGVFDAGDVLVEIEPDRQEATLDRIRADMRSTRASLDLARTELKRTKQLHDRGYAPSAELDQNRAQVEELQAGLEALQAQVATTRMDYEAAFVDAPFDGRVLEEAVAVGQVVTPGSVLARVYPTDAYEVIVRLEDDQAALIEGLWQGDRSGESPIEARVVAQHGETRLVWPGYVERVTGAYDEGAQTVGVVVRVRDPGRPGTIMNGEAVATDAVPLLPGRFVTVLIEGRADPGLLELPRSALHRDGQVWELVDGTLRIHRVEVVYRGDDNVYVRSPELSAGDPVITTDLEIVTDGMNVRPASEATGLPSGAEAV